MGRSLHVRADDASSGTATVTGEGPKVNSRLFGQDTGKWGCLDGLCWHIVGCRAGGHRSRDGLRFDWRRGRRLLWSLSDRSRRCLGWCGCDPDGRHRFTDTREDADNGPDWGGTAVADHDLRERAVVIRRQFEGRLIGFHLDEDITGLDGVALVFDPAGNGAHLHGVGKAGHHDFFWHGRRFVSQV